MKKIKLNNSKSFLANASSILKSNKNIKINNSIKNLFEEYYSLLRSTPRKIGIANFELYNLKNNKNKM